MIKVDLEKTFLKLRTRICAGMEDWMQSLGFSDHTELLSMGCARRISTVLKTQKLPWLFLTYMKKLKVLI